VLSDRLGDQVVGEKERDPAAATLREQIRSTLTAPRTAARSNGDPRPS
jgi:hypothetical protein